jgi:hypothetical protein
LHAFVAPLPTSFSDPGRDAHTGTTAARRPLELASANDRLPLGEVAEKWLSGAVLVPCSRKCTCARADGKRLVLVVSGRLSITGQRNAHVTPRATLLYRRVVRVGPTAVHPGTRRLYGVPFGKTRAWRLNGVRRLGPMASCADARYGFAYDARSSGVFMLPAQTVAFLPTSDVCGAARHGPLRSNVIPRRRTEVTVRTQPGRTARDDCSENSRLIIGAPIPRQTDKRRPPSASGGLLIFRRFSLYAGTETRTRMGLPPRDFKLVGRLRASGTTKHQTLNYNELARMREGA